MPANSSSLRQVVLDDTDIGIVYGGTGWKPITGNVAKGFGDHGPVYNNTLHQVTNTPGANFQFQFAGEWCLTDRSKHCDEHYSSGTGVGIYGSLKTVVNEHVPKWQCLIDGEPFGSTSPDGLTQNAIPLCDSGAVSDGMHHVNVSVVTSGQVFYFDYIYYTPSPSVSLENSVVRVDNTDALLNFTGQGWTVRNAEPWPLTRHKGDQLIFPFYGARANH